jgi:hypothetical protein
MYTLRARIMPVFLVLLPVVININIWLYQTVGLKFKIGSIIFSIAISFFGAQFGRDRGKRKEKELWEKWGGAPTTQFLRHSNNRINSIRLSRYHNILEEEISEVEIPTSNQEKENPKKTDQVYETCVKYLINNTRDKQEYPLIYKENINYGFLRNLWGLKPFGIITSIMGVLNSVVYCGYECSWTNIQNLSSESVIVLLISLISLLFWTFWISPKRIRIAAEAYAERLIEACEDISE